MTKDGKILTRTVHVLGNGTSLATVRVNHGTAELIERWFKSHPLFNTRTTPTTPAPSATVAPAASLTADALRKLARLRDEGILTADEFAEQKRRLLNR